MNLLLEMIRHGEDRSDGSMTHEVRVTDLETGASGKFKPCQKAAKSHEIPTIVSSEWGDTCLKMQGLWSYWHEIDPTTKQYVLRGEQWPYGMNVGFGNNDLYPDVFITKISVEEARKLRKQVMRRRNDAAARPRTLQRPGPLDPGDRPGEGADGAIQ